MSIRGPEALASLEEAMRDIRREEDELSRRVARAVERIGKTKESEAELFRHLAQLRLEPTVQDQLDERMSTAETRAREMLRTHAGEVSAAEASLRNIDEKRATLVGARSAAVQRLEGAESALQALAARVAPMLNTDPVFSAKRKEAEELDRVAEQSLRKTEQAEADRTVKGQPYRDDPLFTYLWERGYGTANYKAGNLVRYLDGLVAGLVGYSKARPNYAMLNDPPVRLREHAERQEANVTRAEAELAALEDAAVTAAGGGPLRADIGAAEREIEQLDNEIRAIEDQRDEAAASLQQLAEGKDPAFEAATAELAAALAREDIQTLLAEARTTRTGQDDTIVAQIDEARTRLREEEAESREQRDRLKTLAARRRELEDIQWEFKKQRFDDPQSRFGEDRLVGDLLNDFLRGGISAAKYWEQWQRSQNWAPGNEWGSGYKSTRQPRAGSPWGKDGGSAWPDGSFGGGGASGPGRPRGNWGGGWSGGNGGFSRPRNGSSGNRRNSGFKTGGGF